MIPQDFPFRRSPHVEEWDFYRSVSLTAGQTNISIVTFTAPAQIAKGWLTAFGHGIDDPGAFATSAWSIRINGNPIPYYFGIVDQLAPFNDPRFIVSTPFKGGDTLDVIGTNGAGISKLFAARLRGFYDYGAI